MPLLERYGLDLCCSTDLLVDGSTITIVFILFIVIVVVSDNSRLERPETNKYHTCPDARRRIVFDLRTTVITFYVLSRFGALIMHCGVFELPAGKARKCQ